MATAGLFVVAHCLVSPPVALLKPTDSANVNTRTACIGISQTEC